MSAPSRRTTLAVPRGNTTSIEFWKAENQKLRERNQSLHRRLHKYKNFVCTLQEDKRKFTFIHKGHRYEFPRLLILARSHVYLSLPRSSTANYTDFWGASLADAIGNTGQHLPENIPPPNDSDPANPMYSLDTTDIFPDFDPTTFHIFLQMLSRFCIYKPDSIAIDRIKQIWRIRDYFDIPTLLLNEDDLVQKIREENMSTFQGIQKELDFALRYNWRKLKVACLEVLRTKTADFGGLTGSMRDAEIMGLLDTLGTAERRKSGIVDKEDSMSADGLEGVRWTTPSENDNDDEEEDDIKDDELKEEMDEDGDESGDIADETTMDLVLTE